LREKLPTATVKLTGSRWVTLNGVQWREVILNDHIGLGRSTTRRVLFYSGPDGWISVALVLPSFDYYNATAEQVLATIRAPRTDLDKLIADAHAGVPAVYLGRKAPYRWALPPIWVPTDLSRQIASLGRAGEGLRALETESYEHVFELGGGGFAAISLQVVEGEEELQPLEETAKRLYDQLNLSLETAMPGYRWRFDPEKPTAVSVGDCKWAEFNSLVFFSKDSISGQFLITHRLANHKGRFLSVTARIMKDHPEIRRIVREALDAIKFAA
jgi:hypothetical protein